MKSAVTRKGQSKQIAEDIDERMVTNESLSTIKVRENSPVKAQIGDEIMMQMKRHAESMNNIPTDLSDERRVSRED